LATLAVSISTDDVKNQQEKKAPALSLEERLRLHRESWQGSGFSLPEKLSQHEPGHAGRLRRTNLMKRRESQALLEGVRKLRGTPPPQRQDSAPAKVAEVASKEEDEESE